MLINIEVSWKKIRMFTPENLHLYINWCWDWKGLIWVRNGVGRGGECELDGVQLASKRRNFVSQSQINMP